MSQVIKKKRVLYPQKSLRRINYASSKKHKKKLRQSTSIKRH